MEREDLAALLDSLFTDFINEPPKDTRIRFLRMTSGTTGRLPMMCVRELREGSENQMAWFTDSARPVVCFSTLQVRLIYVSYFRHDTTKGDSSMLVLDSTDCNEHLTPLLADFGPDNIIGWPFMILQAAQYFDEATASGVRAVRTTGELLRDHLLRLLTGRFQRATIQSQYVTAEIAFISKMSCSYALPRYYHPAEQVRVEIVNPDETGAGDLLVSTLINGTVPVERYRVGDIARIHEEACRCGALVTFELLGRRGHDYIKLAGAILLREEFDRIAALCADLFDDYRAEASEVLVHGKLMGRMLLRVYRAHGTWPHDAENEIASRYSQELFLTSTQTLGALVKKQMFLPLEVAFTMEPFPKKHKDIKLAYHES